jgi:hypothetical protein
MSKKVNLLFLVLSFFILFLSFYSGVNAQFDDDPFEGCGTVNPDRSVEITELCVAVGGHSFISPHIICPLNADVCCPAYSVPSACDGSGLEEDEEEEEEIDDSLESTYTESDENCGGWWQDPGLGRQVCLDGSGDIIYEAGGCAIRSTLCCKSDFCPSCWAPSQERSSCQPCLPIQNGPVFGSESECWDTLNEPPAEDTDSGFGEYAICDSNLTAGSEAQSNCNTCMNNDGIWTSIGCIEQDPRGLVSKLITIGTGVIGGVFLLRVLAAAFMLTTSQGDVKKTSEAKQIITEAIIGVLFVIFSVTILQFIGSDVMRLPGFGG